MIIVTIRTDKPEAEIGVYDGNLQLRYEAWEAHRVLAETLHAKMRDMLAEQGKSLKDIEGIVCYEGPGSFTGLRIGLTIANALAYSSGISIVGETGDDWRQDGIARLQANESQTAVMPQYGAEVHITPSKH